MTVSLDLLRPASTPCAAPAPNRVRRSGARSGPVLAGLAALVALWLGLTAPGVSPVTPAPQVFTNAPPQPVGTTEVVPAPQAPVAGPFDRRR